MNIVLGVTGGISAYKSCDLVIGLQKTGHDVRVIMTKNAQEFITPMTLASLSKHPVMTDMWAEREDIGHIEVSKWAEAFVVYPATANIIAKFANGIADDLLSTVYLAIPKNVQKFIYPAMNSNMLSSYPVKRNIKTLENDCCFVTDTIETMLACGDYGKGGVMKPRNAVKLFNEKVVL